MPCFIHLCPGIGLRSRSHVDYSYEMGMGNINRVVYLLTGGRGLCGIKIENMGYHLTSIEPS